LVRCRLKHLWKQTSRPEIHLPPTRQSMGSAHRATTGARPVARAWLHQNWYVQIVGLAWFSCEFLLKPSSRNCFRWFFVLQISVKFLRSEIMGLLQFVRTSRTIGRADTARESGAWKENLSQGETFYRMLIRLSIIFLLTNKLSSIFVSIFALLKISHLAQNHF
jgi:hypothetical protein